MVVSTDRSARDRKPGLGLGADACRVEPFPPDDLLAVVASRRLGEE